MAIKQAKVQHVVAVPYPAQGHINPMLQLCHQLVPLGFTFTFVNTHHIHCRVQGANAGADEGARHVEWGSCTPQEARGSGHSQQANGHAHDHISNSNHEDDNTLVKQQFASQNEEAMKGGCNPIRMVFVEGGAPPERHAHASTTKDAFMAAQEMKEPVEQLICNIMEEQPVAFILTDILFGWGEATAIKVSVPWVCFWAASAATCAAFIHFADLAEQGKSITLGDKQGGEAPTIESIPGLPPTCLEDLPKVWDETGKVRYEVLKYFHAAKRSRFLLFNTFAELESQVLHELSKSYPTLGVGPLLPSHYVVDARCIQTDGTEAEVLDRTDSDVAGRLASQALTGRQFLYRASLFKEDRTCLNWLDRQAPSSVLFISFGSISARTDEQLSELAHAAEASGCPYLWARKPDISEGVIPASALGRQQDGNGLIVPWAPQLDVLSHPAVGGFLTHCGWNSVMESVAMGVPMLCWADMGERMSNQRFVVQFWKCGLDMVSDRRRYSQHIDDTVLVPRDEIEKSIRCLMVDEAGAPIRARAAHLRESSMEAFRESSSHLSHFAQALTQQKYHDNGALL